MYLKYLLFLFLLIIFKTDTSEAGCTNTIRSLFKHSLHAQSLESSLKRMNIAVNHSNSYYVLKSLSGKNLKKYSLTSENISKETVELVDSLEMIFVHNRSPRGGNKSIEGDALLSARTLGRGAQNTYNYNREFLKSDDNVFFFVKFVGKNFVASDARGFGISYGSISYHLNKDFALKYGWISPFNMYPRELANFLKVRQKYPEAQKALKSLTNSGMYATEEELAKIPVEVLAELRAATFSPSDFEKLVKANLKYTLESLRRYDLEQYQLIVDTLNGGDPNEIDSILRRYVFEPLRLAGSVKRYEMFEFKVPSHVPKDYITIYE